MKRYAYGWLTLGFFVVSFGLHWTFGWFAFATRPAGTDRRRNWPRI